MNSRCTHERPQGRYYCKACRAAQMRDWRAEQKVLLLATLTPCRTCGGQRESLAKIDCRACRKAGERVNGIARAYANVYQGRGHLVAKPCEKCGSADSQKHHPDYSKPLDVIWLCRPCHVAVHGRELETIQTLARETGERA